MYGLNDSEKSTYYCTLSKSPIIIIVAQTNGKVEGVSRSRNWCRNVRSQCAPRVLAGDVSSDPS